MIDYQNILRILKEAKKATEKNDTFALKNLSDQTIHSCSLNQDEDNISIAVTIYSLSKIFGRENYKSISGWNKFYKLINQCLNESIKSLEQNKTQEFKGHFVCLGKAINKISGKLKGYIEEVFEKARINKASRIYEHGISLGQTAKLLGVNLFELAGYAGQTGISEVPMSRTIDIKSRVKLAEEMFS